MRIISLLIVLLILPISIYSQTNIPDSPVGEQLKSLLEAFELQNPEPFIKQNFSSEFLNAFSIGDHLSFFQQVKMMHGGFILYKVEQSNEYSLTVLVKSKKREAWRRLEMSIEENPPYKILGLGIDMAQPPDDYRYSGKNVLGNMLVHEENIYHAAFLNNE